MSEDLQKKEGKLKVSRTVFGKEEVTDEVLDVQSFQTTPATISVKAGATVNLKNYESGRIDIMVSIPCYKEEIDDVFPRVKEFVDEKMAHEYQELKKIADGRQ